MVYLCQKEGYAMKQMTTHEDQLGYLKKIEGQVRGIERMIEDKRYCVDILTQIHSIIGALHRVENEIFRKHAEGCVINALKGKSEREKQEKIDEIIGLISKFRRTT
jgi:DNA-binding FrmR family transcriptional regulator